MALSKKKIRLEIDYWLMVLNYFLVCSYTWGKARYIAGVLVKGWSKND
jgi:hypothetical protein